MRHRIRRRPTASDPQHGRWMISAREETAPDPTGTDLGSAGAAAMGGGWRSHLFSRPPSARGGPPPASGRDCSPPVSCDHSAVTFLPPVTNRGRACHSGVRARMTATLSLVPHSEDEGRKTYFCMLVRKRCRLHRVLNLELAALVLFDGTEYRSISLSRFREEPDINLYHGPTQWYMRHLSCQAQKFFGFSNRMASPALRSDYQVTSTILIITKCSVQRPPFFIGSPIGSPLRRCNTKSALVIFEKTELSNNPDAWQRVEEYGMKFQHGQWLTALLKDM